MERFRISLFIFGTIAVLAFICAVFPEGGMNVGGISLRFPTLQEALANGRSEDTADPEALLLERKLAAQRAANGRLEEFFRNDPARFYLPDGNTGYFDGFFAALDSSESRRINIVHYGDSQIEEDRITSRIRESLQKRFGGGGPGLLPARTNYSISASVASSRELPLHMVYGDPELRAGNSRYGPMGQFVRTDSSLVLSVRPARKSESPARYFNNATLYSSGSLSISCKGNRGSVRPGPVFNCTHFSLPDSTVSTSLSIAGSGNLYGWSLYTGTGVTMDNIPMRGCSGTIFTAINSTQLREYFKDSCTEMIILQYGGNGVPYMKTGKAISDYCRTVRRQIAYIHELAPEAALVFIGPSDMACSINGKRQTYPHLPAYVDSLKANVSAAGAAYWDLFGAMGAEGSMVSWVKQQPALAGPDYIHFTRLGADRAADMFTDALMLYYESYRLRKDD